MDHHDLPVQTAHCGDIQFMEIPNGTATFTFPTHICSPPGCIPVTSSYIRVGASGPWVQQPTGSNTYYFTALGVSSDPNAIYYLKYTVNCGGIECTCIVTIFVDV